MVLTFDPFRELGQMLDATVPAAAPPAMPIDLYRSGDHYVLHCDLAGTDPGSVQVDVDHRILTIRAERTARTDDDVQWLRRERPTGTFERRLRLGDGLDLEKIAATWNDGVLTLTIPVAATAKPRRIMITPGEDGTSPAETGTNGRERPAVESTGKPELTDV